MNIIGGVSNLFPSDSCWRKALVVFSKAQVNENNINLEERGVKFGGAGFERRQVVGFSEGRDGNMVHKFAIFLPPYQDNTAQKEEVI